MRVAACTTAIPYLFDQMVATRGPHHQTTAAMHFTRALLRDVTYFSVATIALARCAPDISADNLWLRWRDDASFASPAMARDAVGACDDSVVANLPGTIRMADEDALYRWFAERYVTTFGPALDALHRHTRVGRRILWGYVADSIGFRMLMVARDAGFAMADGWARGITLTNALRDAGAPISSKPRPFPVGSFDPPRLWAVRGVCCFDYKADPDHGYCVTCPLAADDSRHETFWSLVQR